VGKYNTSDHRSKTSFVKIKRSLSTTSLDDSFDAFVTGFIPGKPGTANEHIIGALQFSIYINKSGQQYLHHIASVPNITRDERKLATFNNADGLYPTTYIGSDGQEHTMSLNPEFDHLVAELTGQALSAKSVRLEHPSLVIWRVERDPSSCIYTQEFIDSQTTKSFRNNGKITY
jgi:ATP-dependent DNA ligase